MPRSGRKSKEVKYVTHHDNLVCDCGHKLLINKAFTWPINCIKCGKLLRVEKKEK